MRSRAVGARREQLDVEADDEGRRARGGHSGQKVRRGGAGEGVGAAFEERRAVGREEVGHGAATVEDFAVHALAELRARREIRQLLNLRTKRAVMRTRISVQEPNWGVKEKRVRATSQPFHSSICRGGQRSVVARRGGDLGQARRRPCREWRP